MPCFFPFTTSLFLDLFLLLLFVSSNSLKILIFSTGDCTAYVILGFREREKSNTRKLLLLNLDLQTFFWQIKQKCVGYILTFIKVCIVIICFVKKRIWKYLDSQNYWFWRKKVLNCGENGDSIYDNTNQSFKKSHWFSPREMTKAVYSSWLESWKGRWHKVKVAILQPSSY